MKRILTAIMLGTLLSCSPKPAVSELIMYKTSWCPACKHYEPILKQFAASKKIEFRMIDIEQEESAAEARLIPYIPMIEIILKGKLAYFGPVTNGGLQGLEE